MLRHESTGSLTLRATLLESIATGHRNLVVDLRGVSFIDSSGLGAFVSAFKALRTKNGDGDIRLAPRLRTLEVASPSTTSRRLGHCER